RLTEPSPSLSSLPNTLSAFATLVPPAPSASSNSDLLILPSPSPSICPNRSFSAAERLLDAVVDPVEDWLCASSSALMVSGEICEQPLPPEPVPAPIEAEPLEDDRPNGLAASWLTPVVCADDFDDVSALRASMADDAAPRAKNMAELQQGRTDGGRQFVRVRVSQQAPCHSEKPNKTGLSCIRFGPANPAIAARRGRFFRPQETSAAALPPALPHVTRGRSAPRRDLRKRTCPSNLR